MANQILGRTNPGATLLICGVSQTLGVTNLAVTLARAIARMTQQRLLVVEAHAEGRGLSDAMDLRGKPGFSDLLEGKAEVINVLHQDREQNVQFVGYGSKTRPSGASVLPMGPLAKVLADLSANADLTLIIGAPLHQSISAYSLSRHVSGVVVGTHKGHDSRDDLERVVASIGMTGTPLLGSVLIG